MAPRRVGVLVLLALLGPSWGVPHARASSAEDTAMLQIGANIHAREVGIVDNNNEAQTLRDWTDGVVVSGWGVLQAVGKGHPAEGAEADGMPAEALPEGASEECKDDPDAEWMVDLRTKEGTKEYKHTCANFVDAMKKLPNLKAQRCLRGRPEYTYCKFSCGVCDGATKWPGNAGGKKVEAPTSSDTDATPECDDDMSWGAEDGHKLCERFADSMARDPDLRARCTEGNPVFEKCKKTCGICDVLENGDSGICEDNDRWIGPQNANCPRFREIIEQNAGLKDFKCHPPELEYKHCLVTCQRCKPGDPLNFVP